MKLNKPKHLPSGNANYQEDNGYLSSPRRAERHSVKVLGKFTIGAAAALSLFFAAVPVFAADLVGPAQSDNGNVVIGSGDTHKNLYTAGGNVTVNADVSGDLTAAGGMVTVDGKIEQEALIAGGNLNISGQIGGNARFMGGSISVGGPIGGDLVVAGGDINLTGKASIAGDLVVAGGTVIIDAPVKGNIRVAGGQVTINSQVGGKVYAQTSQALNFGSGADIAGGVDYNGPSEAVVAQGAKTGNINFTKTVSRNFGRQIAGLLTLAFLIKLLAWLVAAFVAVKVAKAWILDLAGSLKQKPWMNLGIGFLTAVATPIAVIILLVTFVGYYLSILLGLSFVLLLAVTQLFAAMAVGYYLLQLLNKPNEPLVDWQAILIGVVLWQVVRLIPVLGWLVIAVVYLMVLGAMVRKLKHALIS